MKTLWNNNIFYVTLNLFKSKRIIVANNNDCIIEERHTHTHTHPHALIISLNLLVFSARPTDKK